MAVTFAKDCTQHVTTESKPLFVSPSCLHLRLWPGGSFYDQGHQIPTTPKYHLRAGLQGAGYLFFFFLSLTAQDVLTGRSKEGFDNFWCPWRRVNNPVLQDTVSHTPDECVCRFCTAQSCSFSLCFLIRSPLYGQHNMDNKLLKYARHMTLKLNIRFSWFALQWRKKKV